MNILSFDELINTDFNYYNWLNYWMPKIRNLLNLPNDDKDVILSYIKKGVNNLERIQLNELINKPLVIAFGAGPNLENEFQKYIQFYNRDKHFLLSADGATKLLLENNLLPDLVISDLDGLIIEDIKYLIDKKVRIIVLVHGDNKSNVEDLLKILGKNNYQNLIWATQGEIKDNWTNTLGFTDGDRAICLAKLNNRPVLLIGYDFTTKYRGKYSKPPYKENSLLDKRKKIKIEIAKNIINWCMENDSEIYILNNELIINDSQSINSYIKPMKFKR